jgi:hypothetical protein
VLFVQEIVQIMPANVCYGSIKLIFAERLVARWRGIGFSGLLVAWAIIA